MCWKEHKEIGVHDLIGRSKAWVGSVAKERDGWSLYINKAVVIKLPYKAYDLTTAKTKVRLALGIKDESLDTK